MVLGRALCAQKLWLCANSPEWGATADSTREAALPNRAQRFDFEEAASAEAAVAGESGGKEAVVTAHERQAKTRRAFVWFPWASPRMHARMAEHCDSSRGGPRAPARGSR